jgi:hypothetical protein
MNSQICDSNEEPVEGRGALADADFRLEEIQRQRAAIAERRRALAEPTHKLVTANPSSAYHKFTLGGVLVNAGFQAADADALAGLLGSDPALFIARFQGAASNRPQESAACVIADVLDLGERELAAHGLFLTWQKKLALYLEDRAGWLARDEQLQLHGEWRRDQMTPEQRWLIRATCRVLRIAMPGHLLRGEAADWLEAQGANLNYGDFQ